MKSRFPESLWSPKRHIEDCRRDSHLASNFPAFFVALSQAERKQNRRSGGKKNLHGGGVQRWVEAAVAAPVLLFVLSSLPHRSTCESFLHMGAQSALLSVIEQDIHMMCNSISLC